MNEKKKVRLEKRKATIITVICSVSFALLGILAIMIGFAIRDGWASVFAWFTSRWAVYVYITLALLTFVLIYFLHRRRMEK